MPDEHDHELARRRTSDEYRRWNDDRLDDLAETVRVLAPLTAQVGVAQANIDQHVDEMRGIRRYVREVEVRMTDQLVRVERSCTDFHEEYRQDQLTQKSASRTVVIAVIGASATVIAAIIAAIAVIVTGGG